MSVNLQAESNSTTASTTSTTSSAPSGTIWQKCSSQLRMLMHFTL